MPVITFSQRDILQGKIVDPAWYTMKIDSVGEEPAKNGQSINYPVQATIVKNGDDGSTTFAGVPINWSFNSKAIGFAKDFLLAAGMDDIPADTRIDLAAAQGKIFDVFVDNKLYEGRTLNNVPHKYRRSNQ